MPTYSLTLRQDIGRRLTISEMDGNFLYLQDGVNNAGGNLPEGYVSIGNGFGNPGTGSQFFTFDKNNSNLQVGFYNQIQDTLQYI